MTTVALLAFGLVPTGSATVHGYTRTIVASSTARSDGALIKAAATGRVRDIGAPSPHKRMQISATEFSPVSGGEPTPVGAYYEWDDFDENGGMYELTTNYYAHMGSPEMHVSPASPWDLGVNPYVPDLIENWYYGRTPDGTGGAWASDGDTWTYWSRTGDLIATYRATFAGDPAVVKTVTFSTSATQTIDFGIYKRVDESSNTTTIYLRPGG